MADAIFDIPDESRLALFWRTAIVFVVVVLIWLVVGEGLGSLVSLIGSVVAFLAVLTNISY